MFITFKICSLNLKWKKLLLKNKKYVFSKVYLNKYKIILSYTWKCYITCIKA